MPLFIPPCRRTALPSDRAARHDTEGDLDGAEHEREVHARLLEPGGGDHRRKERDVAEAHAQRVLPWSLRVVPGGGRSAAKRKAPRVPDVRWGPLRGCWLRPA